VVNDHHGRVIRLIDGLDIQVKVNVILSHEDARALCPRSRLGTRGGIGRMRRRAGVFNSGHPGVGAVSVWSSPARPRGG
jgi:hypothetical protein